MTSESILVVAVRKLLAERLMIQVDAPDLDLIDSGLVDSLGIVELILEIEQRFEVSLPPEEIDIEDFRTLEGLANLVGRRIPPAAGAAATS
jgi:D-alanine--poly(phosphoribitol) ligase subunit 2